jgi:PAS domain S-box-containing protein
MTRLNDQDVHRIVLEVPPLGVCVVNREGKVIQWSAGAEKLTGYLGQDVLGRLRETDLMEHQDDRSRWCADSPISGCASRTRRWILPIDAFRSSFST